MRLGLLYILLIAILLPTISPWGTIAYYQVNKEYIARVLCENRDKPQLHCNGQCYLAKRLKAQQDKQDKETAERVQHTSPIQLFCETQFSFTFAFAPDLTPRRTFTYLIALYSGPVRELLRPPSAG